MSIELRKINRDRKEKRKCKRLYLTAFPDNERAPFILLSYKARRDSVDFLSVYAGDKWLGFFYVVRDEDLAYIFYFAISETERGKGYGSAALQALKEYYFSYRLFLASETLDDAAPNSAERVKRKNFYLNNGFEDLKTKVQEGEVIYDILGVGGEVTNSEYQRLMFKWMGSFMSRRITTEMQQ